MANRLMDRRVEDMAVVEVVLTVIVEAEEVVASDTRTVTLPMTSPSTAASTATVAIRPVATSDAKVDIVSSTNASVVAVAIVVGADSTAKTVIIGNLTSRGRAAITTTITITITGHRVTEPQSLPTSQDKTLLTRSRLNAQTTRFVSVAAEARTARHRTARVVVIIDETIMATTMAVVTAALEETETTTRRATTLSSSSPQAANRCRVPTMAAHPAVVTKVKRCSTSSNQGEIPRDAGTAAEAANERQTCDKVSSRDTQSKGSTWFDRGGAYSRVTSDTIRGKIRA